MFACFRFAVLKQEKQLFLSVIAVLNMYLTNTAVLSLIRTHSITHAPLGSYFLSSSISESSDSTPAVWFATLLPALIHLFLFPPPLPPVCGSPLTLSRPFAYLLPTYCLPACLLPEGTEGCQNQEKGGV